MLLSLTLLLASAQAATPPASHGAPAYLFFKRESAHIDPEAYQILRGFVATAHPGGPTCTVHIEASSESKHFERHGETVSQRRAIATRSALLSLGISAERIRFDWGAGRAPLEPDQDGPNARNRYVRISWIDPCG